MKAPFLVGYDSSHVLPFIADTLLLSPRDARIGYLGANPTLEQMLRTAVERLGFTHPLAAARFEAGESFDDLVEAADVFVIDLGVDVLEAGDFLRDLSLREFGDVPPGLADALTQLYFLCERERGRFARTSQLRPIVLVNSSAVFWESSVLAQFDCSYTTVHSRVRRATVKPVPDEDTTTLLREIERSRRMMRWIGRPNTGAERLALPVGERLEFGRLDEFGGFGSGWSPPEDGGFWTLGPQAELRISADPPAASGYMLSLAMGALLVERGDSLRVDLRANDEPVAARRFREPEAGTAWRVELPARAMAGGRCDLTLLVENPRSPHALGLSTDDRQLGIHIRSLTLLPADRSARIGQALAFDHASEAERLLGDGWGALEPTGVWTVGEQAEILLQLVDTTPEGVEIVFDATPFLTAAHRELRVDVSIGGLRTGTQRFRHGAPPEPLRALIPRELIGAGTAPLLTLTLALRHPASPAELGLSPDARRLGLHLRSLAIREPAPPSARDGRSATRQRLRRQLGRALRA